MKTRMERIGKFDVCVVIYDITSISSFHECLKMYKGALRLLTSHVRGHVRVCVLCGVCVGLILILFVMTEMIVLPGCEAVPTMFIGNKLDLEAKRQVPLADATELLKGAGVTNLIESMCSCVCVSVLLRMMRCEEERVCVCE